MVVLNACGARALEVKAGGQTFRVCSSYKMEFKDSLGYGSLCLKKQNRAAEIAQQVKVLATTGLTT